MAANFRITSRRKGGNLHLKLSGNFDGMAAMELIYALKDSLGFAQKIYIETNDLSSLHPFGQDVFQKNFIFSPAASKKMYFIGDFSRAIAPRNAYSVNDHGSFRMPDAINPSAPSSIKRAGNEANTDCR